MLILSNASVCCCSSKDKLWVKEGTRDQFWPPGMRHWKQTAAKKQLKKNIAFFDSELCSFIPRINFFFLVFVSRL